MIIYHLSSPNSSFHSIAQQWRDHCSREGIPWPKKVIQEFEKRIQSTNSNGGKSKFDFTKCGLGDKHVAGLVQALANSPAINKVELAGNALTNKSADVILSLLDGQLNLAEGVELDERVDAVLLSEISLGGGGCSISEEKFNAICVRTDCNKYINAQCFVRGKFVDRGAPVRLMLLMLMIHIYAY